MENNPAPTPVIQPVLKKSSGLTVFFSILILLLLGISFYLFNQNRQLSAQIAQIKTISTPTPTQAPEVDETVGWQTFSDSINQYSFQYPNDIFIYKGNATKNGQYWSNKKDGGSPLELGEGGVWLNMSVDNPGKDMIDFYNKIINLDVKGVIKESAITKLSNHNVSGTKGSVYHIGIPLGWEGESSYTYEAVWVKEQVVFRLSLSAFTEKDLQLNKNIFDKILSTFKFASPSDLTTWQTYLDPNNQFSFQYPQDAKTTSRDADPFPIVVQVDNLKPRTGGGGGPEFEGWMLYVTETQSNPKNISLRQWAKDHNLISDTSNSGDVGTTETLPVDTSIGGLSAIKWSVSGGDAANDLYLVKKSTGVILIVAHDNFGRDTETVKKILSTFKFK